MNEHSNKIEAVSAAIRAIPDFPKPGILFRDITTLLSNGTLFRDVIDLFAERYQPQAIDQIVGIDARGFIFGAALACQLGIGFVPVRKPGKLPFETIDVAYELEYGSNRLSIHADALQKSDRVVIIDDLLATGGTAAAAVQLVEKLGATIVEVAFLIELCALNGQKCLQGHPVFSLIQYED